ncbi:MAG: hypothetical protein KJZ80_10515 [Hyphomicrobiaceae bacterium]|nr:hypothetical protein [Hyphomicrobiaceae bacterium]
MAKGQQRSNREKRKPKGNKAKPPPQQASPFPPAPGLSKRVTVAGKKSR